MLCRRMENRRMDFRRIVDRSVEEKRMRTEG
jgi:hypothetical protein